MLQVFEILEELESHGQKRKIKEEILTDHRENKQLQEIFKLTYDWLKPFYVTDAPEESTGVETTDAVANSTFLDFKDILDRLHARELSGHAARDELAAFFKELSPLEGKWYRRVIRRDLRMQVGTTIIKKVWPGLVSSYGVQLAVAMGDPDKLEFPMAIEPKFDGLRITVVCKDGAGQCFTRNGRLKETLQFIADQIAAVMPNGAIDGEIFHENWNLTSSVVQSKVETLTEAKIEILKQIKLYAFDHIELEAFDAGKDESPLTERFERLKKIVGDTDSPTIANVVLVEQAIAEDMAEVEVAYDRYLNEGYEGVMLKILSAGYVCKRGKGWLKYKPEETLDAEIIGTEEGTGRNAGRLGAIIVKLDNGTEARVGSGYSDILRNKLWDERDDLPGRTLEFKVQKEKNAVASVRFPVYVRIRADKDDGLHVDA